MITNIQDYSKALYFQENINNPEDKDDFCNIDNQAINFYKNCMKDTLEILTDLKSEYIREKEKYLNKDFIKIIHGQIEFIIYTTTKTKLKKSTDKYIFKSLPIFLTDKKKIYIPKEVDLRKNYLYLGSYPIEIGFKK